MIVLGRLVYLGVGKWERQLGDCCRLSFPSARQEDKT